MQTKAIVQVMSQMLKEKDLDPSSGPSLKKSPYESLKEKVEKAGIPPFELSA